MSKAIIKNGVWVRKIKKGWIKKGIGRTDIFKSVLANSELKVAEQY